jgi:cobalt-zinc-cadmium efflux system membrane fusion protein
MRSVAPALVVFVVALGCRGRDVDHVTPKPEATPAAEAVGGHHGEEDGPAGTEQTRVRIDPEMLRDLRVTTAVAESRPGAEGTPVLGELRVNEDAYAEVGSPVPARVVRLLAAPGQVVRRGQILAELQSLELGKSRGEYGEALARVELARKALERKRSLAQERIAPQREVQEAEAELKTAEAGLQAARSALQALGAPAAAGNDGSRFALRAPVSGTVIDRNIMRGQVTEPAQTLFKVGDLSVLWLTAHASERDAVRVRPGSQARVAIPALPGMSLTGRVAVVGSQVEVSSRTIPVRIEINNRAGVLRPGMSATVWLPVGGEGTPVIAVPVAALQRLDEKWSVFIPRAEGVFEVRNVGRGRDLGGEVEILSGLAAGETVVVEGAFLLKAEAEKARGEGEQHAH